MDQIKRILAPTDLSQLSQIGVRYAFRLAKALGAEVTVYHVVSHKELVQRPEGIEERMGPDHTFRQSSQLLKGCQLALARFLNDHFSDLIPWVRIREKVEFGVPDKKIVEWAKKEGTDIIVISALGRTGPSHMLLGSVTEKVIRDAPCPVLTIHPQAGKTLAREGTELLKPEP